MSGAEPSTAQAAGPRPQAAVLRAARQAQAGRWRWWLLGFGLAALVPLLFAGLQRWRGQAVWPVLHPMLVFMLGLPAIAALWGLLAANLGTQNLPSAARLVPGHAAALRQVLLGGWALATLLAAALLASLFGEPLAQGVVAGLALAAMALALRQPWAWGLPVVLVLPLVSTSVREPALAWLATPWQTAPWLMAGLALMPTAVLLPRLLGDGGTGHRRHHTGRRRRQQAIQGPDAGHGEPTSVGLALGQERWLQRLVHRPYHWCLARLLARADSPAWPRLLLGLGPTVHPATLLNQVLTGTGIALGLVLLTAWLVPASRPHGLLHDGLLLVLVLVMMQMQFVALGPAMRRTRREQALLRLVPGAPDAQAFNRRLGRSWALQHLALMATATLLGLALCAWLDPAGLARLWPLRALAYLALTLPFAPLMLWRDWARVPAQDGWMLLAMAGLLIAELAGAGALWWLFGLSGGVHQPDRWPLALLGSGLAFTALLLPWRWRRLLRAPVAWPGGRLARR